MSARALYTADTEGPAERELRSRIYAASLIAHNRACEANSLDAGEISHIASGFAQRWSFNRKATHEQLEAAIKALSRLFQATAAIERLEGGRG
jgi:ABC-type molybdenum transport system ATPase subunit/photorepair protein PhrA